MDTNQEVIPHRLFIGGLFNDITPKEIRDRFASFGQIGNIQIIQRKDDDGKVTKTFCYMDINASHSRVNKCISLYSKAKWKGNEIKIQSAKENYLTRLEKEWKSRDTKENEVEGKNMVKIPSKDYKDITTKVSKMKAVVPGTKISDEPNWIIGKYGRPLPIVHLRYRNSKLIKFDPSKHCHQLKKLIKVGDEEGECLADLSWSLEESNEKGDAEGDSRKRKKRKIDTSDCNGIRKENPAVSTLHKDDWEKEARRITRRVADGFGLESKYEKSSEFNSSTELDANLPCNEDFLKKKKVNKRKLSKIEQNSSSGLNSTLYESKDEAITETKIIEPSKELQQRFSSILERTKDSFDLQEAFNDIPGFSGKCVSVSDIVIEKDGFMKDAPDESELGQSVNQVELSAEDRSNVSNLGESIVSQIARKRTKSCTSDGDLSYHSDLGGSFVNKNSREKETFSNQSINMESEASDIEDGELSKDSDDSSKSEESSSESDEDECEEVLHRSDEESVDEESEDVQESSSTEETSSEDENYIANQTRTSKNGVSLIDYEGNASKHDILSNGSSSSEDSEVSSSGSDSECSNAVTKVNNKTERKETTLSNGKMNDRQSMLKNFNRKKELSEEKRLNSLNERKKAEMSQRQLVSLALKSEDLAANDSKHIQFGSSDEENDDKDNFNDEITDSKKVTGTASLSWLGLDDSGDPDNHDDDDDDDDDDGKRFEIKKQFEGSKGAELFKLHKKAALDERFKVDARFLDSESESENIVADDGEVEMDVNNEMEAEKSRTLSILDDLLGKKSKTALKNVNAKEKSINDVIRYDPLDAMHAEYEKVEEQNESETESIEVSANEQKAVDKPYPEVAQETYYNVSGDLKGLFGKKESQGFSFLSDDANSSTKTTHTFLGEATILETKKHDTSYKKFDDESGDEDVSVEDNHTKMEANVEKVATRNVDTLFFFTEDDPRLKSNASDSPSDFMRKEPMEELYRQLEANRERLRQDFKRKHKDAIRRQRKKVSVNIKIQN